MADPKVELREVKEELAFIEQQLAELLDRQQQLTDKKQLLEESIRDAALATSSTSLYQGTDWTKADFEWSQKLENLRNSVFKLKSWRPLQLQTMNATLSGRDCILIMPTGGGKSLCFQLPALASKGFTLVVSPLISLMEDQLMALHELNIDASLLNASSSREEVNRVHAAMIDKKESIKMLYVTPEKLAKSKRFMAKLEKAFDAGRLTRLVIDEVHCCSQWGHDFRPDYKFLGVMKRQFPGVPILGLTATATSNVVQDVKTILGIQGCTLFRASFNRHNLYYEVRPKPSVMKDCMADMQRLIITRFRGQSGIVYCFSRKDSEDVAAQLRAHAIKAACYHAYISIPNRNAVHKKWLANKIQVVVATIAFGMGIDKPDVRFVIHHSMSKSMENYYQESGRAGRDDKTAHCILYVGFGDMFRQSTMVFTEQTGLDNLYGMVTYAYDNNQCRRTIIARHFGERWDSAKCNGMCDHCEQDRQSGTINKDITQYGQDLLVLLGHAKGTEQRVTGLKLLDAWQGKGASSLLVSSVKTPRLTRMQCEQVVAYLLLHGYIREDFHFTPYNTISYLLAGPRSKLLSTGQKRLEITFPAPANELKKNSSSLQASGSHMEGLEGTQKLSKAKTNTSLKFINPEKSAFIEGSPLEKITGKAEQSVSPTSDKVSSVSKHSKVRKAVIESDSDDDLDFGETEDRGVARKRSKLSNSVESTPKSSIECITIDDDDDDDDVNDKVKTNSDSVSRSKDVKKTNKLSLLKNTSSKSKSDLSPEKKRKSSSSSKTGKSRTSSNGKRKHSSKGEGKNNACNSTSIQAKGKKTDKISKQRKADEHQSSDSPESQPSKVTDICKNNKTDSDVNEDSDLEGLYDTYTEQLKSLDKKVSAVEQASRTKFSQSFPSVADSVNGDYSMSSVVTDGEIEDLQNDYMQCLQDDEIKEGIIDN